MSHKLVSLYIGDGEYYTRTDADAVIAELKAQVNGLHNRANLWHYNAQNEHNAAVEEHMKNAKLKYKLAEKDKQIEELKTMMKEPSVLNRTCRKCGSAGTLMYMPIAKDGRTYWNLYNNKGIDYVLGIQCAHCGEVAFVTKQTHEYELRRQKHKRCLRNAEGCKNKAWFYGEVHDRNAALTMWKWRKRWLELAEQFKDKEAK